MAEDEGDGMEAVPHFAGRALPTIRFCTASGVQRLENLLTGAFVGLPAAGPSKWELLEGEGGFGYLQAAGCDTIWANMFFTKTVWRCSDGMFVQTQHPDEEPTVKWISDVRAMYARSYFSWGASGECMVCGTWRFVWFDAPVKQFPQKMVLGSLVAHFRRGIVLVSRWFLS